MNWSFPHAECGWLVLQSECYILVLRVCVQDKLCLLVRRRCSRCIPLMRSRTPVSKIRAKRATGSEVYPLLRFTHITSPPPAPSNPPTIFQSSMYVFPVAQEAQDSAGRARRTAQGNQHQGPRGTVQQRCAAQCRRLAFAKIKN